MNKRVKCGLIVIMLLGLLCSCSGCKVNKTVSMENKLVQYMQDVYAPRSMIQFKEAKEDSRNYFTDSVTERFFVSFRDNLTSADLERTCSVVSVIHGEKENQSDGKERYKLKAYLYNTRKSAPIIKEFTFLVNDEGFVDDFIISDAD
jgi:hypothetical protein